MSAAEPTNQACSARLNDGLMICAACGFEWAEGTMPPRACDPISYEHLRRRMFSEATAAEASLKHVLALEREGVPVDAVYTRRRLAEIDKVAQLVDRVAGNGAIKEILAGKNKP